jgi:hypothetical protein
MRSPGVIYRRYRQLKKKILYDKIEQAKLCRHENCHYGKDITYTDVFHLEHSIRACNYNNLLSENKIEICTNPLECNAFVNKWSKEKIIEQAEKELLDHDLKKKLYPEITIMEWVLDKDLYDAAKNPGFFGVFIVRCIEFLENLLKK